MRRGSDEGDGASYRGVTMVTARPLGVKPCLHTVAGLPALPAAYWLELPRGEGGVSASAWRFRAN